MRNKKILPIILMIGLLLLPLITAIGNYNLTTRIVPNPTTYAEEVRFYATPTHPEGELSNITCNITNTIGDLKQLWNILNVPSGVEVYNSFGENELIWLDFQPANYTYTCYAESQISGNITSPINMTWQVMSNGIQSTSDDLTKAVVDTGVKTIVGFRSIAGLFGIFLAVIIGLIIYKGIIKKK